VLRPVGGVRGYAVRHPRLFAPPAEDVKLVPRTGTGDAVRMDDQPTIERLTGVGRYAFGIQWKDGHDSIIPHRNVRFACPCEECLALDPESRPAAGRAVEPRGVECIGDTSLVVEWADGHTTILLQDELRALCRCARCVGEPDYPISGA